MGEQYRSLSSSLCNFLHSPVTSSHLGPNILLNNLFSNTLSLRSLLSVSDQVSHPHKTGKIKVLYILIFPLTVPTILVVSLMDKENLCIWLVSLAKMVHCFCVHCHEWIFVNENAIWHCKLRVFLSYTSAQKLYLCNLLQKKRCPSPHICSLYESESKQCFTDTKCCHCLLICLPAWRFANRPSDFKEYLTLAVDGIVRRCVTQLPFQNTLITKHTAGFNIHRLRVSPSQCFSILCVFLTVTAEYRLVSIKRVI